MIQSLNVGLVSDHRVYLHPLNEYETVAIKKPTVCTGTRVESETSLDTFVHENVKVYMKQYMKFFL